MQMNRREFEIELGQLVMRAIAEKLAPEDILTALEGAVRNELEIRARKRAMERTY